MPESALDPRAYRPTCWFPLTAEMLRTAGMNPNMVPIRENAITTRGVLMWTGKMTPEGDFVHVLVPWNEAQAEMAQRLIASFEMERDLRRGRLEPSLSIDP